MTVCHKKYVGQTETDRPMNSYYGHGGLLGNHMQEVELELDL